MVSFVDKLLNCRDCGKEFVFTAGEQQFYASKGLQHEPRRCNDCRNNRRQSDGGGSSLPARAPPPPRRPRLLIRNGVPRVAWSATV